MMNQIENWENVEPNYGEFKRLKPGGYICQVIAITQEKSQKGNDMLVLNYDIAEGEDKGYFMKQYKNAPRTNEKEPKWAGKFYLVLNTERIRKPIKRHCNFNRGKQSEL